MHGISTGSCILENDKKKERERILTVKIECFRFEFRTDDMIRINTQRQKGKKRRYKQEKSHASAYIWSAINNGKKWATKSKMPTKVKIKRFTKE